MMVRFHEFLQKMVPGSMPLAPPSVSRPRYGASPCVSRSISAGVSRHVTPSVPRSTSACVTPTCSRSASRASACVSTNGSCSFQKRHSHGCCNLDNKLPCQNTELLPPLGLVNSGFDAAIEDGDDANPIYEEIE